MSDIDEFVDETYQRSPGTRKVYKAALLKFEDNYNICEITKEELESYLEPMSDAMRKVTRAAVNNFRVFLGLEPFGSERRRINMRIRRANILTDEEFSKIKTTRLSLSHRVIIEMFIATSCTKEELVQITIGDIDLASKTVMIGESVRFLTDDAVSAILAYAKFRLEFKDTYLVYYNRNRPVRKEEIERALMQISEDCNVPRFSHTTIRNTMALRAMSMHKFPIDQFKLHGVSPDRIRAFQIHMSCHPRAGKEPEDMFSMAK